MTRRTFLALISLLLTFRWESPRSRRTVLSWTTLEGEVFSRHFEERDVRA